MRAELAEPAQNLGVADTLNGSEVGALGQALEQHVRHMLAAHPEEAPGHLYEALLAEMERPLIKLTLAATRGNQIKAAEMLGLNRNTLRKKIKDLEIPVVRGVG